MAWVISLLVITILISINALYVAAEFSTVSARRSRLVQIASEGNPLARLLLPIVNDRHRLDVYIATCQLGITASSLLLGFFGQASLTPAIEPMLGILPIAPGPVAASISATSVLIFLTCLQVILGELVPKSVAIQFPERLALITAIPIQWSSILFKPFIWVFNGSGQLILRWLGIQIEAAETHIHAPRELMLLFEESSAGGLLDEEERRLLKNSLQLRQLAARQVMIPRNRMLAAPVDQPCSQLLSLLADSPYSRLPLFDGTIDNIVGLVHLKDLLCLRLQSSRDEVGEALRPALFVPETMPVDEAFALLQRKRQHVAIVLDEYGGTAGIITLEDLIEEIFGELQDEFDTDVTPQIRIVSKDRIQIRGDMLIEELNEILDLAIPSQDVDTIGGYVLNALGHVPSVGEKIPVSGVTLSVDEMDGKGVTAISIDVTPEQVERLQEWMR